MSYSLLAKRLRLPLGFVFAALYLWLARPSPRTFAIGAAIALAGLLVRGWASGHIVKNDRLATTGPYAHTRNPLYFGSFLIACGFAIAAHWILLIVVAAFFLLIYAPTIAREKANVSERFPEAYAEWARHVPPFVPRLTPWRGVEQSTENDFSSSLYMRHGEWKAALGYLGAMVWLTLRLRGVV